MTRGKEHRGMAWLRKAAHLLAAREERSGRERDKEAGKEWERERDTDSRDKVSFQGMSLVIYFFQPEPTSNQLPKQSHHLGNKSPVGDIVHANSKGAVA